MLFAFRYILSPVGKKRCEISSVAGFGSKLVYGSWNVHNH